MSTTLAKRSNTWIVHPKGKLLEESEQGFVARDLETTIDHQHINWVYLPEIFFSWSRVLSCAGRGSTSLHLYSFFESRESKRLFLGKLLNAQYQKGETNRLVRATGSSQFLTPQRNKSICSSVRSVLVHKFKHLSVSESQHTWPEYCAGSSSSSSSSVYSSSLF